VHVLDADPPTLARRGAARRRASELSTATGRPDPASEIARRGVVRSDHLAALGINAGDYREIAGWLIADDTWTRWITTAPTLVEHWAVRNPLEPRMPLPALARALELPDDALLDPVLAETELTVAHGRAARTQQPASIGPAEDAIRTVERHLHTAPFQAPDRNELRTLGLGHRELAAAGHAGRLLRISDDVVLLPDSPERAVAALRALPQPFTIGQARAALDTTRRVCIPLLEYLDSIGRTERVDAQLRRLR
jgi:selenocysteine-specific elongation factor